jgi:hypothetical protein
VTLRSIAIRRDKHYLSADFETNKAFYDDATKSQGYDGANVAGAERQRAAGLSRVRRARGDED